MKISSLGLKKPDGDDIIDIQDFNDNVSEIDRYLTKNTYWFSPVYGGDATKAAFLFIRPIKLLVNAWDSSVASICPEGGAWWIIDYTPIVTSTAQVQGNAGEKNTVTLAYQHWTGFAGTNNNASGIAHNERLYRNGAWGAFVRCPNIIQS